MRKPRFFPIRVSVLAGMTVLLWVFSAAARQWPDGRISEVTLDQKEQVKQGFIHWSGPGDAYLNLKFLVQGEDLILQGIWKDDYPLLQLWPEKIQPQSRKMEFGADGIRIGRIAVVDGSAQLVSDFLIDLGPYGTDPRIILLDEENPKGNETLRYWSKINIRHYRVEFQFGIPLEELLPQSSNLEKGVWVVRLYDIDGDGRDYAVLEDRTIVVQKEHSPVKTPPASPKSKKNQSINKSSEGNQ